MGFGSWFLLELRYVQSLTGRGISHFLLQGAEATVQKCYFSRWGLAVSIAPIPSSASVAVAMPSLARVGSLSCPFPGAGRGHSLGLQAAPWLSPLSLGKVCAARGTEEVGLWSPRAPGREGLGMPVQPWISALDPIIQHQSGQWIICSRILRFLALPLLPLSPLSLLRLLAVWVALGLENAGRWLK